MAFGNRRGSGASDVAHAWAHQTKKEWRKGNVFFDGKAIYSYGRHFPMAVLLPDNHVAINAITYSNSTSRHQSSMQSAVSHMQMIKCYELPTSSDGQFESYHHSRNINQWINKVKVKLTEIAGKRQQRTKDRLMGELHDIQAEATRYIEYFKLKLKAAEKKQLFTTDIAGYIEGVKRANAAAKRKATAIANKGRKLHPVWLEQWRNFNEAEWAKDISSELRRAIEAVEFEDGNRNRVRLRAWVGDGAHHISTTKNVVLPIPVAERYYHKYLKVVAKGGCSNTCGYKMMEFEVTEMNADHLLVGCHDIARSEIDYVANKLGWIKNEPHPVGAAV